LKQKFTYAALAAGLLLFHFTTYAQSDALGGWYLVNFNYHISNKFTIYSEVQTRSQHVLDDFYYRELKTGVNYKLKDNMSVFVGFGNYETDTFPGNYQKPIKAVENRLWEQFVYTTNLSRINIENRVRIEQRWINGNYANRLRYRLNLSIPVNHPKIQDKTFFPVVFDEVFFTDNEPHFLRNRIFGGAGYRFSKVVTVQAGFLRQSDFSANGGSTGKNFITTSLLLSAWRKQKAEHSTQHSNVD
jgi:hypothetical protein